MIVVRSVGVQHFGAQKKFKKALAAASDNQQRKKERIKKIIKNGGKNFD